MASKLNFRARTLDASKPMQIYYAEELPELSDLNAINRSVPAMPSGMEKEEEAEKHLQDILESQDKEPALAAGGSGSRRKTDLFIPTPEVLVVHDADGTYKATYKGSFKLPRAFIHVQPFAADQDLPDYDMDEEDERFLQGVLKDQKKFDVDENTFESMLDRLEKNSGHNVVSVKEAKLLLKQDDELILAVYDYWVDKRLRLKQPLIPVVKSDKRDVAGGSSAAAGTTSNNPYIAFRRRTEKMQTRKNRKNDEASYEKMLKLRRDLSRAVTLLEMVRRREKTKKENLNLTSDIFNKRYESQDFDGRIISDVLAQRQQQQRILQPASQAYMKYAENWVNSNQQLSAAELSRQKRHYNKKKRHKSSHRAGGQSSHGGGLHASSGGSAARSSNGPEFGTSLGLSSDDERSVSGASPSDLEEEEQEGPFAFKRKRNCQYLAPNLDDSGRDVHRGWPWDPPSEGGGGESKYRYSLASVATPKARCIGMVRRRVGRGGRIVMDRAYANYDDLWRSLDFNVTNGCGNQVPKSDPFPAQDDPPPPPSEDDNPFEDWPHYRPVTPPHCAEEPDYDPYNSRLSEAPALGLPTMPVKLPSTPLGAARRAQQQAAPPGTLNGLRPTAVDQNAAQNAAGAVVSNDTLELFGGVQQQSV